MIIDESPKPVIYKLQIIYDSEGAEPDCEPPENRLYTTASPPVVPRIGESYSPHDDPPDDVPSGWEVVPWTVEDVDHTVWPEADKLIFDTRVFLQRDAEHVARTAKENHARHPDWKPSGK